MPNNVTVAIGEVVIDWISTEEGASVIEAVNFSRFVGGNAVNVSIALARLGRRARLVGKMGTDLHALLLKERLMRECIDLAHLLQDPLYPTAQCYAFRKTDEETIYFNWPRPNASDMLNEQDITADIFKNAIGLHATGISLLVDPRRRAVLKAARMTKEAKLIFSFDAGFPTDCKDARAPAEEAVAMADLLKVNLEELLFWTGNRLESFSLPNGENEPADLNEADRRSIFQIARTFFEKYRPLVLFVTLGHLGSCILTSEREIYCRPFDAGLLPPAQLERASQGASASSSIGAGDAYMACIIDGLLACERARLSDLPKLEERQWQTIARRANAAGALATRTLSATGGLPTAEELEDLLEKQPENRPENQPDLRNDQALG